ncbi:MAG TPA: hypothetical protein VFX02_07790 [Gammaproteobacteria bacterium]|nr:hypothetical protein [Gammaproteobacteria bacterium]
MLVDRKWIQAAVAVIVLTSVQAYAADTEEEETYASKMKSLSQNSAALMAPTSEESKDALLENDLKNLAKQDQMKAQFKPDLSELKPKL